MKVWIKGKRKDGKIMVIVGFDNGKRFKKIVTPEELKNLQAKAEWRE